MRYHYEDKSEVYTPAVFGKTYICDHPVYNRCTLFEINDKGLAVIQQRYHEKNKSTFWGEVDDWLVDKIYLHPRFKSFFDERAGKSDNGIYPTVSIRQIM